jgi:hypothetical protein
LKTVRGHLFEVGLRLAADERDGLRSGRILTPLGHKLKEIDVRRPNDSEISPIQGGNGGDAEPFGDCDHGCVDETEAKIGILADECNGSNVIFSEQINYLKLTCDYGIQKSRFSRNTDVVLKLPRGLSYDRRWNLELANVEFQHCVSVIDIATVNRRD